MFKVYEYSEIDQNKVRGSYVLIDVRSPGEYKSETIPGAINIPLFEDEERKIIGTVYVQENVDKAKRLGMEFAARKLPNMYEKIAELDKQYDNLIFFCARGGLRSSSVVSLFVSLGVNAFKLSGGYKGYRTFINENLPKVVEGVRFVVLYGNTGTGKTDILKAIEARGRDILDLEGCANHRGSLLGSVGLGEQNTQKMFESLVYETLKKRKGDIIFVEGESKRIGRIIIPQYLYCAMDKGINIKIEAEMETRVDNILKDYVYETDDELIEALDLLRKHISDKNIDRYIDMIRQKSYREVIEELMIKYYDPMYEYKNRSFSFIVEHDGTEKTAERIIEWVDLSSDKWQVTSGK